ncbi:MAG TPA: ABC transporter permease [Longimicrobiales bacterium]|nr:ABC transporter permease [Longimicrobiales bacterium]
MSAPRMALRAPDVIGAARDGLDRLGRGALLAASIIGVLRTPRKYGHASLAQAYHMGIRSLPLVLFMAAIGGALASQQTGAQFTGGLPLWVIGSVVAAGVLTELGPVLTALVLIGRVGASIAAELATMKVTEQIDALYAIGRDPVTFLVVPRVVGGMLVVPPLVIVADAVGMFAGWIVALFAIEGLTTADFIFGARFYFRPWVLFFSVIKAAVFGVTITFLACFMGLEGRGGAEGVGRTTTAAVVATTVAIMLLDVLLVPLLKVA